MIEVGWLDDTKRTVHMRLPKALTYNDLLAALDLADEMQSMVAYTTHMLVDARQVSRPPQGVADHFPELVTRADSGTLTVVLIDKRYDLVAQTAEAFSQLTDLIYLTDSLEDALDKLEELHTGS